MADEKKSHKEQSVFMFHLQSEDHAHSEESDEDELNDYLNDGYIVKHMGVPMKDACTRPGYTTMIILEKQV